MLKTAHDAEEFMRTGARVSPSWPGGDLRGRIRCSRLISRRSRQNPLQTGRAIRCRRGGPYVFNKLKHFRAIATRYDKLAKIFLAAVHLACAAILLN